MPSRGTSIRRRFLSDVSQPQLSYAALAPSTLSFSRVFIGKNDVQARV